LQIWIWKICKLNSEICNVRFLMLAESARMSSSAEARFRVQAPNSRPPAIAVVALDGAAESVVRRLAGEGWQHAAFFLAAYDGLSDLAGGTRGVDETLAASDLVILVAGPGGRAQSAAIVGEACSRRRIMTTGCLVGADRAPEPDVSKTLAQLRPWSLMLVIARSDEYIGDMLAALRA
jgi:hypothetical protein